jgi:hypothetical protein
MTVFVAQNFKRNYECTNIVAIVAETLPARFSAEIFKAQEDADLKGLTYLGAEYQNGERCELYGYL